MLGHCGGSSQADVVRRHTWTSFASIVTLRYPSRPVVAIEPLAYFRRCGKRVALRLVMYRTEVGYVLVGLAAVLWAAS